MMSQIALVLLFLPGGLGYYGGYNIDAISLAIEYFDPQHKRSLNWSSAEASFMSDALQQIYSSVPETSHIHRRVIGDGGSHSYNSLVLNSHGEDGKLKCPKEAMNKIAAAVTGADAAHCLIEEVGGTTVTRDCSYSLAAPSDGSREAIAFLRRFGFAAMRMVEYRNESWMLIFSADNPHDPFAVLDSMKRDSTYEKVFGEYDLDVYISTSMIGDGSWVRVEKRDDQPTFTSEFSLRFSYGWGDCMSGCIYRHDWIVRCRPRGRSHERWEFYIDVREEGTALPDATRACLRCERIE